MIAWCAPARAGSWDQVEVHRAERVVLPGAEQRVGMAELVADLARSAPSGVVPPGLAERAAALGFALTVAEGSARLAEPTDALRGGGWYAVRLGELDSELVLQAPHPFSDLGTGRIASDLFDGGGVRALCVATAHRDAGEGADPAHTPEAWFQAVTQGLAGGLSSPGFVQIHGFAASRSEACAVVSDGATRADPAVLRAMLPRLGTALACADVRTGDAVPALAARTNVQGRLLADGPLFLHLELSPGVRERLLADAAMRAALKAVLIAPVERP